MKGGALIPRARRVGDNDWAFALRGLAFALTLTAAPIFLHAGSQAVAIIFCIASTILVARAFEQDVPTIILVANIFSNVFISLASIGYADFNDIEFLKSYNFITTIVCYLVVAYGFLRQPTVFSPFVRRMIVASIGVLAIVGIYFIAGAIVNFRNAAIYLRNIALPIFIFQSFLIVGVKHRIPLPHIVFMVLSLLMVCCYIELFSNDLWLSLTNGLHYLTLNSAKRLLNVDEIRVAKEQGIVITSVTDYSRSALFNTSLTSGLNMQVQRLNGPNFNPISLGYLLSILIAFAAVHNHKTIVFAAMPLLIATSAKGPLILTLGAVGFFLLARKSRSDFPLKALAAGIIVYVIFVFQSGYRSGDYHVLGLLGGLNGFLKLPIGHSLGDGGNLSIPDFSKLDWSAFQSAGAAEFAVESSIGVLLYQMGVCAALVLAFYLWIARTGWRLYKVTKAPALAFATGALSICLANGVFQEEAYFAPLSLPVVMGLVALSLGAADRALSPRLRTEPSPRVGISARRTPSSIWPFSSRSPKPAS
jgi:hypothetical protein